VEAGKTVFIRVKPIYQSLNATRPYKVVFQVRIDGKTSSTTFRNPKNPAK